MNLTDSQIDIGSYPAFVKSGDWKDPFKVICMAIAVLEEKHLYLVPHFPNLQGDSLHRAITAAYNCGQGNVAKCLNEGLNIDARTYNHDYSQEVWRLREIYNSIQKLNKPGTGLPNKNIMGDFRIVINAIGGHGQDRDKKDGEIVDFGENTPEAIAKELVEKLKASGVNVEDASVIHWPLDNYVGQLKNGRKAQIVDDLVTGKRIGSF